MFAEFKRILYPVLVFRSMILANVRALWSGPFQALSASGRGNEVEGGGGGGATMFVDIEISGRHQEYGGKSY